MKAIYKKLHEAKLEIGRISKNAKNPHFKNTYADLNALIEAVEPILLEKGLVMLQPILDGKVKTLIVDFETGEQVESAMDLPAILDPQKLGSAITYFRRYTLQSLLSLQAVDDDGQAASTAKQSLPTITDERFDAALLSIANGSYTKEKLIASFTLTPTQNEKLR
jgi:hypothetical protein